MNRLLHRTTSVSPYAGRTLKMLAGAAAALALAQAAPAMATTLTFESQAQDTFNSGVTLAESGYDMLLVEGPVAAAYGYSGTTGLVLSSKNNYACDVISCPSNGSGNYLGIVNDGAVTLGASNSAAFKLQGLDYAFLAPVGGLSNGSYGMLQLTGTLVGGQTLSLSLAMPGQDSSGRFAFTSAQLGGFSSNYLTSLTINACAYDALLACTNSFAAPAMNLAQFAIDNISVTAVPEPEAYLSMLAGLGVLGLVGRRQRRRSQDGRAILSATTVA